MLNKSNKKRKVRDPELDESDEMNEDNKSVLIEEKEKKSKLPIEEPLPLPTQVPFPSYQFPYHERFATLTLYDRDHKNPIKTSFELIANEFPLLRKCLEEDQTTLELQLPYEHHIISVALWIVDASSDSKWYTSDENYYNNDDLMRLIEFGIQYENNDIVSNAIFELSGVTIDEKVQILNWSENIPLPDENFKIELIADLIPEMFIQVSKLIENSDVPQSWKRFIQMWCEITVKKMKEMSIKDQNMVVYLTEKYMLLKKKWLQKTNDVISSSWLREQKKDFGKFFSLLEKDHEKEDICVTFCDLIQELTGIDPRNFNFYGSDEIHFIE